MKYFRCSLPLFAMLVCLASSTLLAQQDFWQHNLPVGDLYGFTFAQNGEVLVSPDNFVYTSTNEGQAWQQSTPGSHFFFFSLATGHDGTIYGGGGYGVTRSTDNGGTWTTLLNTDNLGVEAVAVRPNGHVFIGTGPGRSTQGGLYSTTDEGQTWTRHRLNANPRLIEVPALMVTPRGNVLASIYNPVNRVYISKDDGHSWRSLGLPISRGWWWVFGVAGNGDLLAAGGIRTTTGFVPTLYRSSNEGSKWKKIYSFPQVRVITSIAAAANGDIYVGSYYAGVYRSTDNGTSFTQVNSGLANTGVNKLGISPGGYLYALVAGDGLYRSQLSVGPPPSFSSLQQHVENALPSEFNLHQNYPNPFNPTTTISFELKQAAIVTLNVSNTLGQVVAEVIHNELMDEGTQDVEFDASALPSGVYYYKIVAQDIDGYSILYSKTRKMLLIK